ncbi:hypothetical protein ACTA71_010473 [Dictyostelium dimigraforme]
MVFSFLKNFIFCNNKINLFDKLIVVTGASSGIGLGITNGLAKKGSKIILIARNEKKLKRAIENIKIQFGNEKCYYICSDLTKEIEFNNCLKEIERISNQLGQYVEILINSAGSGSWKYIEDTSFNETIEYISSPFCSTFNMTSSLLKPMLLHGNGTIVTINTPMSMTTMGGCIGYISSRWALRGLTECLRYDLSGTGVNILEVIGGEVETEYFQNNNINTDQLPFIRKYVSKVSVDQLSKETINAIENRNQKLILPFELKYILLLLNIYPFSILFNYLLQSENSKNHIDLIKLKQQQFKFKKEEK